MDRFQTFLNTSYTGYQGVENLSSMLLQHGFCELEEGKAWSLCEGGAYFVRRNGDALIAFRYAKKGGAKVAASHTDSPCLKLKENPLLPEPPYVRLNAETYGSGLFYTFFDRPLKLAGRLVRARDGALVAEPYVSDFTCVIPSLAIHQQSGDTFTPAPQKDLPLLSLGEAPRLPQDILSYDLYAVPAEESFISGAHGEFLTSPRLDDLAGVYTSFRALAKGACKGLCVAACLSHEEVGSRAYGGAWSDFLRSVLERIAAARGEELYTLLPASFLLSVDNAQCLHPNHPETCDPTNRVVLGGGVVIKHHAGGAYTTDALSSAVVKTVLKKANVPFQTFYNRSDMHSGTTLGALSLVQAGMLSADIGIAQLAMHSAMETAALADCKALLAAISAFYESDLRLAGNAATVD